MRLITLVLLLVLSFIAAFIIFWRFIFLRNPKRAIPKGSVIVSPADGKIISILHIKDKDKIEIKKGLGKITALCKDVNNSCYVISIFMNLFDVHVNRSPLDGEIISITHEKGRFLPVTSLKNGLKNEKTEILLRNKRLGKFKLVQIAGFLARRIEVWVETKQKIKKGQVFGRINLGSQVALIIPDKVRLGIRLNQKVKAGETVLAYY